MHRHRKENRSHAPPVSPDNNRSTGATRLQEEDFASFEDHYRAVFRETPYYSSGRHWSDYAPAYRYGHRMHAEHRGHRFEEVEAELADHWDLLKDGSHLAWAEARGAVRDIWQRLENAYPGDRDRMP